MKSNKEKLSRYHRGIFSSLVYQLIIAELQATGKDRAPIHDKHTREIS